MVLSKCCRVWRKYKPRSVLLESKEVPDHVLLFESDVIAILSPMEAEILRKEAYADSFVAYGMLGVLVLDSDRVTYRYLVMVTGCQSVGKIHDVEIFRLTEAAFVPLSIRARMELVQDVGKLLASGKFFFAHPSFGAKFDLLSCAQKQGMDQPHYYWNKVLITYLQRFGVDISKWLFRVICGNVEIQTVYAAEKQTKLFLCSRLSCERAGTRFNVRGINDDGHVANFVETEQAIYVDDSVSSFVQVRGLVPLFWDQPGIQTGGGISRIKFSRGYSCSQPVFERHFEWCLIHYGPILCLNLLGTRDFEQTLTNAFQEHLSQLSTAYCAEMRCFDYHRNCRGAGNKEATLTKILLPEIQGFKNAHGFYLYLDGKPRRQQTGTIRTNCLDCLDRTNSVQSFLGLQTLPEMLSSLGLSTKLTVLTRFKQLLSSAWFQNGDSLSRLYSGTRALKFQGRSKLKDGARSVQRTIQSNFLDGTKQEAIDMLLFSNTCRGEVGMKSKALLDKTDLLAPIPFKQMLCDRWSDYTIAEKLRIAVGTWNVNGGTRIRSIALKHQSLSDWLLDIPVITGAVKEHPSEFLSPPDIYVIGFQELVGLTASNIVSASSSNRKEWGAELQRVLSRDHPYELLTAEQLVGVCLYIFISPKLIPYIRDVAVSTVKTGLSGKAGNKGGVAIRFLLHSTSVCFVCSHFAAHQTKVLERNQDFADICRKVSFPHGQTIDTQDYVIWCGDLNYRIDLPTSLAKEHIATSHWDKLCKHDQLCRQKKLNKVFQGYIEGELNFAPTYKYDEFSDDYDTSEKCRTPAWCDRILWKRKPWSNSSNRESNRYNNSLEDSLTRESEILYDFGPHKSDASTVCQHKMGTGGNGDLIALGHQWHPGRLIYYNRAELKQSDHRPVLAIIEVDIYRVDPVKRSKVREEVCLALGPPDPTVVIEEEVEGSRLSVQDIIDLMKVFGEIVLVRVMQDCTMVTYGDSPSALAAITMNRTEVKGTILNISLHSPWPPGSTKAEAREHSLKPSHPSRVTVLTGEQLMGQQLKEEEQERNEEAEEQDEIIQFSFSEQLMEEQEEEGSRGTDEPQGMYDSDGERVGLGADLNRETVHVEEGPDNHTHLTSSSEDDLENREDPVTNEPLPVQQTSTQPPLRPPRPAASSVTTRTGGDPSLYTNNPSISNITSSPTVPRPIPPRPIPPRPSLPRQLKTSTLSKSPSQTRSEQQSRYSPEPPRRPNPPNPGGKGVGKAPPPRPSRPPPPRK